MEKIYFTIKNTGILNLIIGAGTLITGVLLIISGAKLLEKRSKLLF